MSMNDTRTFASAIVAVNWKDFWLYCTTPLLGIKMKDKFKNIADGALLVHK
jgi:hypothetical protein